MKNNKNKSKNTNPFPAMEEEVLSFWEKNKIFEKSVEREASKGDYVFYDGPPFATGTPHYGHIIASLMKDVVPRYWTMQGYRVERKWGWDCHGLPIENIIEKEMGTKHKKEIEEMGIDKFNEACRSKVLTYVDEWKKTIRRFGRWVDMENAYKTMDKDYMESVWWVFSELYKKDLIYEGYKSMHICPRCETTLSQAEVAEGYKDVKDLSVIAKFKLQDTSNKVQTNGDVFILAWTTTPWTLIGNTALAINNDIKYSILNIGQENYIIAKDRIDDVLHDMEYEVVKDIKGSELVGLEYKPLFPYYNSEKIENHKNAFKIYAADFVTTEEGTGVVHIAPAFGQDDMSLGKQENLPFIQHIGMDGVIKDEAEDFKGMEVKPIGDTQATDVEILKYLAKNNALFAKEKYEHSYPHCWRCDTPLLNYATGSWFVRVEGVKGEALKLAKEINWTPGHLKEGRFGQWLEGARDWSISRQRFWASAIPIWRCSGSKSKVKSSPRLREGRDQKSSKSCDNLKVISSVAELEELSGQQINDLHKHAVDKITFKCEKCGGTMQRIPDVLDCWFESGSMPYAQKHYPFDNVQEFEQNFPAEFIAEGVDQTRAWFYYLHIIATAIKNKPAFKNVIVNGIVLAEDGKKMAKKLQNYPEPDLVIEKFGADALRYYLITAPVMQSENLNFEEKGVQEAMRKVNMLLWNVLKFYELFTLDPSAPLCFAQDDRKRGSTNVLDKWILARLNELIAEVTKQMNEYNLVKASRPIEEFINDLSTWYIRRSRDRFKSDDKQDKQNALATTKYILTEFSKVIAPFIPFIAEQIWQKATGNDFGQAEASAHLEAWPVTSSEQRATGVLKEMEMARKIVELGLAKRDEAGIKVRQPLSKLQVTSYKLQDDYVELIKDEVNVKEVKFIKGKGELSVELDTKLTPELEQEGIKRELVRAINNARREAGMTIQDQAVIYYQTDSKIIKEVFEKFAEEIKQGTLSDDIQQGEGKAVKINKEEIKLKVTNSK